MTAPILEPGPTERWVAGTLVRRLLYPRRPPSHHVPPEDAVRPRIRFTAEDGARLVGIHYPAAEAHGIVVLVHPDKRAGKHWWSRHGIPQWLNDHGLDAFTFDLPRYGESHGGNVYLHAHVIAAVEEAALMRPDVPIHLWGVSIGSYAALNAAVVLPQIDSLILESPYPTFRTWYRETGHPVASTVVGALERLFPTTYARIDAAGNAARLATPRILIAASLADRTTPAGLSRMVAAAAPSHASYLECDDVAHLRLFREAPRYRAALLETLGVGGHPTPIPHAPLSMSQESQI